MRDRPWFWLLFPAAAMSLGWGLRGSIGGGPLGAMIPGAMIGLALCLLLGRERGAGTVAAFAAIGVGFGGQETYGQTVGLSFQPETYWWAILGFAVKGAVWGLLGGAFLGMAFDRRRIGEKRMIAGFAAMALGTWAGWSLIDHPKLIYFSNRLDRPREELWAGLWLGGLLLLAWLRARIPALFALYGTIGGGIGFAFGASLQPWGRGVWEMMPLGWWKAMELTFGALLGLAYGLCCWRLRGELAGEPGPAPARAHPPAAIAFALVAVGLAIVAGQSLHIRFGYTVAGAALAACVLYSEPLAWQTAITATYAAFSWDALKHQQLVASSPAWAAVVLTSAAVALIVAARPRTEAMFLLLTWTAVVSSFRYVLPPAKIGRQTTMVAVFVALAVLITLALHHGRSKRPAADAEPVGG